MGAKFWEFKNFIGGDSADLNIYSDISDQDYWEEGLTTPKSFQQDLKAIGPVTQLNIHLNSRGGGVFAGHAISNLLRAHPANKTIYVDGLAASIASIIAMAGDKVVMQPGSMMMIHNPMNFMFGAYNANEMRDQADTLDQIRDSLVSVYQAKTGKEPQDIVAIMDAETWYTAEEAVQNGFADEVGTGAVAVASLDGSMLNIAGRSFDLSRCKNRPKVQAVTAKTVVSCTAAEFAEYLKNSPEALQLLTKEPAAQKTKEDNTLDIKELQAKFPDVYQAVLNQGVNQERQRMQAIDEVAMPGHEALVNKARYETGESAETLAMSLIKAEKAVKAQHLTDTAADAKESNVNKVPDAPAPENNDDAEAKAAAKAMADAANKGRE